MALLFIIIFFIGTFVGSILPELGNLVAVKARVHPHKFNVVFLVIGIIGIVLALYIGYE